eukprot:gene1008-biopygen1270
MRQRAQLLVGGNTATALPLRGTPVAPRLAYGPSIYDVTEVQLAFCNSTCGKVRRADAQQIGVGAQVGVPLSHLNTSTYNPYTRQLYK